jgi:lactaldehyde dehydrogenase/glycolaldehyde dehydrogenase
MDMHSNFIGGRFVPAQAEDAIEVFNPSQKTVISRIPRSSPGEVDRAVAAAKAAQPAWARLAPIERARMLNVLASKIRDNVEEIAHTISEEQGKPLPLARSEARNAAGYLDYNAEWARRIEGEIITSDNREEDIFLYRKPIGVAAGILPWNYPFFLIVRKLAPALVTGNSIVIKPSEETPNNAVIFARLLAEAGLPDGIANFVHGDGRTGSALAGHPDVGIVSFTGSVDTGRRIMTAAAANITKVSLELGGKGPVIVLKDADIDLAVRSVHASRIHNTGQVCNSAERIYLHRAIAAEFTAKIADRMAATRYGDPLGNTEIDMGPLINRGAVDRAVALTKDALARGATLVTGGGEAADLPGHHFQPTVLADVPQDAEVMRKEAFAPVLPLHTIDDLEEGIAKANDTEYGLASSIFTGSLSGAMKASRELAFGETYINRYHDETMQGFHAGLRRSGIGGSDGKHGLYEYTSTHVVYLQN